MAAGTQECALIGVVVVADVGRDAERVLTRDEAIGRPVLLDRRAKMQAGLGMDRRTVDRDRQSGCAVLLTHADGDPGARHIGNREGERTWAIVQRECRRRGTSRAGRTLHGTSDDRCDEHTLTQAIEAAHKRAILQEAPCTLDASAPGARLARYPRTRTARSFPSAASIMGKRRTRPGDPHRGTPKEGRGEAPRPAGILALGEE